MSKYSKYVFASIIHIYAQYSAQIEQRCHDGLLKPTSTRASLVAFYRSDTPGHGNKEFEELCLDDDFRIIGSTRSIRPSLHVM